MKVLTPEDFNRICAQLWGENSWRPAAAKALKKGVRTIERYSAGDANVPADVRKRLAGCTAIRAEEMTDAFDMLSGYTT